MAVFGEDSNSKDLTKWMNEFINNESVLLEHLKQLKSSNIEHSLNISLQNALKISWDNLTRYTQTNSLSSCSELLTLSKNWAQIALDFSWEQLNIGHWKNVHPSWRVSYSTASLLKALCLAHEEKLNESLAEIDKALLLGAPIMNSILQNLASVLTVEINKSGRKFDMSKTTQEITPGNVSKIDSANSIDDPPIAKRKKPKIMFRNYTPIQSLSMKDTPHYETENTTETHHPESESGTKCKLSDMPLIDPSKRVVVKHCPSLEEFLHDHMMPDIPVVLTGVMDTWPAYSEGKWR